MLLLVSVVIPQHILVISKKSQWFILWVLFCKYFHTVFWKELQWFITFSSSPEVSPSRTPGLHGDPIQSFHKLFEEVDVFCKKFARLNKIAKQAVNQLAELQLDGFGMPRILLSFRLFKTKSSYSNPEYS